MISVLGLGRVGRRIARALRAGGERVRASHRSERAEPDADEVTALDLDAPAERRARALKALAHGARLLVWGASRYDPELIRAVSAPVLLLGSTSVYGEDSGRLVDEAGDPAPSDESGRTLLRAEEATLATGGCVLRLAGIYARGRGPQSLLSSAPRTAEGRPRLEPPAERLLNLIHEEDAARAALFAIERGLRGVCNVSDGRPLTRGEFYRLAARSLGLAEPVFSLESRGPAKGLGRRVSNAKLLGLGFALSVVEVSSGLESG